MLRCKLVVNALVALWIAPFASQTLAIEEAFPNCVERLQGEAREWGLSDDMIATLGQVQPLKQTIKYDRNQPEFVQTFAGYYQQRVNSYRIETGRQMLAKHRDFLKELTQRYGVPGQYLVAFWAMESNFGRYIGKIPVLDTLATLACDERRSAFFTGELFSALELMSRNQFDAKEMQGSWAGAIGQTQFLPSVYLKYGVDGDGDQRVDLWRSEKDALTSAAYFLQQLGWVDGLRWGREVELPTDFAYHMAGIENRRSLKEWRQLGVTKTNGSPLPDADVTASLLIPVGAEGPKFLVYKNFDVIMQWNRSQFYALSVGILADRINGAGQLHKALPDHSPLTRDQIIQIQEALEAQGFNPGKIDGQSGPQTTRAISAYQQSKNQQADGFPDQELFKSLLSE